jgi:photosystem II stability/assembly factor-like uncharacterized protein
MISARFIVLVALAGTCAQAQWQMQTSNTNADLRGIHSVGNGVAWASGTNGTVLRTEDGGYVWQTCVVPPGAEKLDFRGVQGFDANTAIVMSSGKGDLSRLYKTTDGCHTWNLVFKNPDKDGFWDALKFDSPRTGMLIGDPVKNQFPIFTSINAGDTWSRVDRVPAYAGIRSAGNQWAESMFAASNSTLMVFQTPRPHTQLQILFLTGGNRSSIHIIQSFDEPIPLLGGRTMVSSAGSLLAQGPTAGGFSFAARSANDPELLVAVGGDYQQPDSANLTASYCSWKEDGFSSTYRCEAAQTPPHGYRSSVAYDEKTKTWITVGPNGTDISTDDGRSWRAVHPDAALHEAPDADRNWNAISLPYLVGPKGRIGKLDEGAIKR